MTKSNLFELIVSWENLKYLVNEIATSPELYKMLMDIAIFDTNKNSWRAAYMIDKINDLDSNLLQPFLNEIIKQVLIEKNRGKKRHFLKLISLSELSHVQQGFLFDFCLQTFMSDNEPVAVRVHAMQILHNISVTEPDLIPEILFVIENEMTNHLSAGIISRGSKLIKNLKILTGKTIN